MCLSPLFSGVLSDVIRHSKRVQVLLYSVLFCPLKSKINSFLRNQFSRLLSRGKEKRYFLVFLSVLQIKLSSFCWYFLIFWPFIYSTLNKCLETWSFVCGYCAYGLFLCFRPLWNISQKRHGIRGGSREISCRSQWVRHVRILFQHIRPSKARLLYVDLPTHKNLNNFTSGSKPWFTMIVLGIKVACNNWTPFHAVMFKSSMLTLLTITNDYNSLLSHFQVAYCLWVKTKSSYKNTNVKICFTCKLIFVQTKLKMLHWSSFWDKNQR